MRWQTCWMHWPSMRIDRQPGFPAPGQPGIFWLGQAGFWLETGDHRILIDP